LAVPEPWIEPHIRTIYPLSTTLTLSGKFFTGESNPTVALTNNLNCTISNLFDDSIVCQLIGTIPAAGTIISAKVHRDGLASLQVQVAIVLGGGTCKTGEREREMTNTPDTTAPTINQTNNLIYANAPYVDIIGSNFPPDERDITVTLSPLGECGEVEIFNSSSLRCHFSIGPDRGILLATVATVAGTSAQTEIALVQEGMSV